MLPNALPPLAGLPPARSRLLRHVAEREQVAQRLDDTKATRAGLADDVASNGAAEADLQARVAADARDLLVQIRRKARGALALISGAVRPDLEARHAAARHRGEVGKVALVQLDEEIGDIEKQLAELDAATEGIVADALLEYARCTVGGEYRDALIALRKLMTRLEGAERAAGGGRYTRPIAEVPSFLTAGQRDATGQRYEATFPISAGEADLADAVHSWKELARAWLEDPRADPARILKFGPLCANPTAGLSYDQLHRGERREVDIAFANPNLAKGS